jgi:phosphoribosylformylglycinamidine synthase
MTQILQTIFKERVVDAAGEKINKRILSDLGIEGIEEVKTVDVYTVDANISQDKIEHAIQEGLFGDLIVQDISGQQITDGFDWLIHVGFLPGVRDVAGSVAQEALEDLLEIEFKDEEAIYFSRQYLIKGKMSKEKIDHIAKDLLANEMIQQWQIIDYKTFEEKGLDMRIPKVDLDHIPQVKEYDLDISEEELVKLSDDNNWALKLGDLLVIREYFSRPKIVEQRKKMGLTKKITDIEMEAVAQTQSDHCTHKRVNSLITYKNKKGEIETIDSLFKTHIKKPAKELAVELEWIVSVLDDNAGVVKITDDLYLVVKGETHNSPSNKEPYGGAITGIVGVYRDPMGTGKGAKIIAGMFGYCTGSPFYDGELQPILHPRRLLEGVRKGVEDGGNLSGVPTVYGYVSIDENNIGKSAVFVTAVGTMPSNIHGESSHIKHIDPDDLIVTVGGRVGKDGIHGVTEASLEQGAWITSGHVQMGDPFTQKKVHDFLNEARDRDLYNGIQDSGGGGLSSVVGEMSTISNGCELHLDKVPLKYHGLDPWEILVSESQERMVLSVDPKKKDELFKLAQEHNVELAEIGTFTDSGKFHVLYGEKTVSYLDVSFMHEGFPQWEYEAEWDQPLEKEPELEDLVDQTGNLVKLLAKENICSDEYIFRQYDHEVQGTSVIKPYLGADNDVKSDAAVLRAELGSKEGVALSVGINQNQSKIDTYHMAVNAVDEAIRRVIAVGADPERIALMDNFTWPRVDHDPEKNPDGKHKLAQLVEAFRGFHDAYAFFKTPPVSGKDSMSMDGTIDLEGGGSRRVSAPPTLQVTSSGIVDDVEKCVSMEAKCAGDVVYIVGETRDELGASEFYDMHEHIGRNIPKLNFEKAEKTYHAVAQAIEKGVVSSCHGCYKGGLAVALAQSAFAGEVGMKLFLEGIPTDGLKEDYKILFSESQGRFVITIPQDYVIGFEDFLEMSGVDFAHIGVVTDQPYFVVKGLKGNKVINTNIFELKNAYKKTYEGF